MTPEAAPADNRRSTRLVGGVGSSSGAPGVPARGGFLGWLFGSRALPLPGIADFDLSDVQNGADWTNFLKEPPPETLGERSGICCSGGGIRAASFCLGGLEALQEANLFAKTDYLSAVSGGGYIAVAHAALLGLTRRHADATDAATLEKSLTDLPPWSLDAPETVNLRNHTTYLAPNLNGRVWGLAVTVYGAIEHLLPFAALIVILGVLYGSLLTVFPRLTFAGNAAAPTFDLTLLLVSLIACGGALVFAALLVFSRQSLGRGVTRKLTAHWTGIYAALEVWAVRIVLLAMLSAVLLCLVPLLFAHISDEWHRLLAILGGNLSLAAVLSLLTRGSQVASSTTVRRVIVIVAAYVAGPLVLAVAFLLMAYVAASRGVDWSGFGPPFWILISLAYLIVVWLFDDEVVGAMHILYRERLSTAFIRYRTVSGPQIATDEPPWDEAVNFAPRGYEGMPRLVVCAAVNVADDVVPPGRFAGSFTFEQDFSGGPLTGYVRTSALQEAAGDGVLTLPAMMAISGAAFSPLMGRTTRPGWRVLFALFDVRLGVWLPNPRCLGGYLTAREIRRYEPSPDDLALPLTPRAQSRGAIHRFQKPGPPRRWYRPGWSYALREAFGLNSLHLPYVYVTDGGHFENLGLVELLRRGCTQIICFDASEDGKQPLTALGQAIALARDELGVDISIDTKPIWPGSAHDPSDSRLAQSMVAQGTVTYPNGRKGRLIFVKNHLPVDAPRDVLSYAETDHNFPFDTTLNQFFDDQRFDAYRELGYFGGQHAAAMA